MEHSASRRVDVLMQEAPHLIAAPLDLAAARRLVSTTGRTLQLAIATGRRELDARGAVSGEVWSTIEDLGEELERQLGELERAERLAGRRDRGDVGDRVRVFGAVPPSASSR
jgi:hypothetical protein